jgi:hypothetical protein
VSRRTQEIIGLALLILSMIGIALLSGLMPVLGLPPRTASSLAFDLAVLAMLGAVLLVLAIRQEGVSWKGSLAVALALTAIILIVLYIPLWYFNWYLPARDPLFIR